MTPTPNWADKTVKALNVIRDGNYHPSGNRNNEQACRSAFDRVRDLADQIVLSFKRKGTGPGLQKYFDDLNESLKVYRKHTSKPASAGRLVDAYMDAFSAWRNLNKKKSTAA